MPEDSLEHSQSKKRLHPKCFAGKGVSDYTLAKHAEYHLRDLVQAEHYYRRAIVQGERAPSAIKDLASLLHQQGRTREAIELLERNMHCFMSDYQKFFNLYTTLKKQLHTAGKCHISSFKISGLGAGMGESEVRGLFKNPVRIKKIDFASEVEDGEVNYYCIAGFNSHSSARKTLEGFTRWNSLSVEWIDKSGNVLGDAHYARQKIEEYRKNNPTFDFVMFDRDPKGYVLSLPVDGKGLQCASAGCSDAEAAHLLGASLYTQVFMAS